MMFTSVLLACHIIFTSNCMDVIDNRGPYKTRQACIVRLSEMFVDTRDLFKRQTVPFVIVGWKCDKENTV